MAVTLHTVKISGTDFYLCRVPGDLREMDDCWTSDPTKAKLYTKPGPARSAITTILRLHREAAILPPKVVFVRLDTTEVEIDDMARAGAAVDGIIAKSKRSQENYAEWRTQSLRDSIERQLRELQELENHATK